jgi:hypothetical protein
MERGVLVERPMSPQLIVVGSILRQNPTQVRFTQNDSPPSATSRWLSRNRSKGGAFRRGARGSRPHDHSPPTGTASDPRLATGNGSDAPLWAGVILYLEPALWCRRMRAACPRSLATAGASCHGEGGNAALNLP